MGLNYGVVCLLGLCKNKAIVIAMPKKKTPSELESTLHLQLFLLFWVVWFAVGCKSLEVFPLGGRSIKLIASFGLIVDVCCC